MSNRLVKSDATGEMTISTVLGPKIWRSKHLDPRFSLFYRRFVLFERLRMESGESECIIRFLFVFLKMRVSPRFLSFLLESGLSMYDYVRL